MNDMGNILDRLEETGVDVRQLIADVPEAYDWRVHFWLDMESSRLKTTDVARLLPEFLISNRFVRDCSADVRVTDTITTKYYFDVNCDIITVCQYLHKVELCALLTSCFTEPLLFSESSLTGSSAVGFSTSLNSGVLHPIILIPSSSMFNAAL